MDENRRHRLVRRLERIDARNPALYRLLVGAVAVGGYLFYAVLILGTGVAIGFLCAVITASFNIWILYAMIGLLIVLWSFVQSLWVKLSPPQGIPISEHESPPLFNDVRDISARVGGPSVNQVLVTDEFNASLSQLPRLGVFGWQKNYLSVGLPLLAALSHDEFRAVLAHEFGHLSGFHGRFGGWVYRVRQTWVQGATALRDQKQQRRRGVQGAIIGMTSSIIIAFLNWYVPLLDACSFVLRRRQEYEADAFAARLFGPETMVRALANIEIRSQTLTAFWKDLWTKTRELPEPPANFYGDLARVTSNAVAPEKLQAALAAVAEEATGSSDSHPCLRDRAAALGIAVKPGGTPRGLALGEPVPVSAWQHYFGNAPNRVVASVEDAWRSKARDNWTSAFQEIQTVRQKESELAALAAPSNEQLLELAHCKLKLHGAASAMPLFEEALRRDPNNRAAKFQLAQIYLHEKRPEGEPMLLATMAGSIDYTRTGLLALHDHYARIGNAERARHYEDRLQEFHLEVEKAQSERQGCSAYDTFLPAELSAEALQKMRSLFAEYERLEMAYVVRKAVKQFPEHPYFVVGLKPRRNWWGSVPASETAKLIQIAKWIELPGQGWVVVLSRQKRQLEDSLAAVAGSQVYSRNPQ